MREQLPSFCANVGPGNQSLGNGNNGIDADGAGTIIGGPTPGDRNVISGNTVGIYLQNTATDVLIEGNYIGTNASVTMPLATTTTGCS